MSSQFSPGEISSIIIAWLVLSVAITYSNFVGLLTGTGNLTVVVAGFIATATGFIIHEMGHKFVAIRHGYVAHFRLWMWGLLLTLFIVVFSGGGIVFGAPGAVYIAPTAVAYYGYDATIRPRDPEQENMIISAAGPGINLAFAVGFLSLLLVHSECWTWIVQHDTYPAVGRIQDISEEPLSRTCNSSSSLGNVPVSLHRNIVDCEFRSERKND